MFAAKMFEAGRSVAPWLLAVAAGAAAFGLASRWAPTLEVPTALAYFAGSTAVCVWVLAVSWCTPSQGAHSLPVALGAGACVLLQWYVGGHGLGWTATAACALLLLTSAVGALVGSRVERPSHLFWVAVVSSVADALSLYHPAGVSHAVSQSARALATLAIPFPMLGSRHIQPLLGGGDVVFVSLYLTATRIHGLSIRRSAVGLAAGFGLAFALALLLGVAVPVLPALGLGIILCQPTVRRFAKWSPFQG